MTSTLSLDKTSAPTSSDAKPVRLKVSTPSDLVATLPYMFGFTPHESIIVLALDERRIVASARVDAAAADHLDELATPLGAVTTHGDSVIVVGWIDDVAQAQHAVAATAAVLGRVDQTIIVSRGRCRAGDGPWTDCPTSLEAAEQAGLEVLPDRQAVVKQVAGPGSKDKMAPKRWAAARVKVMANTPRWRNDKARQLLLRGLSDINQLSTDDKFELAALVHEGTVRDTLWGDVSDYMAGPHVKLWTSVVAVVPDAGAPAPLGLLAMAAWLSGEGALQTCCLQRGLAIDHEHSLLRLADSINMMGIHPGAWPDMRRSLLALAHEGR
ncbi:MAG: DUF4192 domain-containing protein [Propionibacteriaceae bacterium]|nr:DUF4192 domain-containing protein [Propionibacteriaceae bacterium]